MKLCLLITTVSFLLLFWGAEGLLFARRSGPDPKCEKLFNFATSALAELKTTQPRIASGIAHLVKDQLNVNVSNPTELREILCKVAGFRTARELYDFAIENLKVAKRYPISYEYALQHYKGMQNLTAVHLGGYTNANRALSFYKDLRQWVLTLPKDAKTPAEATDLPTLTRFFQEMQVKYGSRWLSFIRWKSYQTVVVKDPTQVAKDFFEARSTEELAEKLGCSLDYAMLYHNAILLDEFGLKHEDLEKYNLVPDAVNLIGDLGYLNLKY